MRLGRLEAAREVLAQLQTTRENYHMIDDEFQLPVLAAQYLADSGVSDGRKREFLLDASDGQPRLARLLRELALVATRSRRVRRGTEADEPRELPETRCHPLALRQLARQRRGLCGWAVRDGRERDLGPPGARGDGHHPGNRCGQLGLGPASARLHRAGDRRTALGEYMPGSGSLRRAVERWRGAKRHFEVTLAPAEIRERVRARLEALPAQERRFWETVTKTDGSDRDSLRFLVLSLDADGKPIPVVNTDPATALFLEPAASAQDVRLDLAPIMRPYPVGLFVEGLGPLVANDAFAPRARVGGVREGSVPLAPRRVGPRGQPPAAGPRQSDLGGPGRIGLA